MKAQQPLPKSARPPGAVTNQPNTGQARMNSHVNTEAKGILSGIRVIEFAGIGPAPFAAMMLADQGADVIRIDRPNAPVYGDPALDQLNRGKRSILLDLKGEDGIRTALQLISTADTLIEGYRPEVMERLGLGPDICLSQNPKLVYGRMTGWGQQGSLAARPGHDLNYLALTGALHAIGTRDSGPIPPLNLVADFGGGGMMLAYGLTTALLHVQRGGAGQVIDAAMIDGVASMMAMVYSYQSMGLWHNTRDSNLLDGAAPHYHSYQCQDKRWLAVAPIEPAFFKRFLDTLGINSQRYGDPHDQALWPQQLEQLKNIFATRPRDAWAEIFQDLDACVTPVLDLNEAPKHPHNLERGTFIPLNGSENHFQPGISPRFSSQPGRQPGTPCLPGQHTAEILAELNAK